MKPIVEQVDDFMLSKYHNIWLDDGIVRVFVRKSRRNIKGVIHETFDIANISTIPKQYQGQGYFKNFIQKVESIGLAVYVESIHNPLLTNMLEKNGYTIMVTEYDTNAIKYPS